jgi:hypothetical protein
MDPLNTLDALIIILSSSFLITIVDCVAKIIGISYKEILEVLGINSESYLKKAL